MRLWERWRGALARGRWGAETRRARAPLALLALLIPAWLPGCEKDREMAERMEMPDTTMIMEAMTDREMQDSLLDMMPGGEMVRGDSVAAERLMRVKMGDTVP